MGQSGFKYISVKEDVELNLGAVSDVVVKPTLMKVQTENFTFNHIRNISGWDKIQTFKIEVKNTRRIPAKIEIQRNFHNATWDLKPGGDFGEFKKVDLDTVKFTLKLKPRSKQTFTYVLRTYHGDREQAIRH